MPNCTYFSYFYRLFPVKVKYWQFFLPDIPQLDKVNNIDDSKSYETEEFDHGMRWGIQAPELNSEGVILGSPQNVDRPNQMTAPCQRRHRHFIYPRMGTAV